ncbi:MAG TPA: 3'-5' exonuclease [Bacteroidales bacterium]|nr:3'-5' exonuclease [Bacteroidales bacterium]
MLNQYQIESILFLDIETVPAVEEYQKMPELMRRLWDRKAEQLQRFERNVPEEKPTPEELYERAGIYAEFGKIICISTGIFRNQSLWIKSFSGNEEKPVLAEFSEMLNKAGDKKIQYLCAHNGKEFDYPYLIRRMLVNGVSVPALLDLSGKKPWEVNHLDTMELWKFGDFKNFSSLELLAAIFGIPTPKDDMDGSQVARVYWQDHDLPRIVKYCQKDVLTIVNLFLKLQQKKIIGDDQIQFV